MSLLSLSQLSELELKGLLQRSVSLAGAFGSGNLPPSLQGKRIAVINDDRGWRNTAALDLGAQMLGALCTQTAISLSGQEDIRDLAGYLGNWFDLIAIRSPSLEKMSALAAACPIPVLNLRTHQNHPCETLGDLSFLKAKGRSLNELSVVAVCAAGNIIHSWAEVASVVPLKLTQIAPRDFWINQDQYSSPNIRCTDDFSEIAHADVLITDCWPSDSSASQFRPFQITSAILDGLNSTCLFIPCPPVTRGQEVSVDAMRNKKCVVTEAKAHLLHAQNACLEFLIL